MGTEGYAGWRVRLVWGLWSERNEEYSLLKGERQLRLEVWSVGVDSWMCGWKRGIYQTALGLCY
jgi:hypothetical protein